jgi:hypothetical protein
VSKARQIPRVFQTQKVNVTPIPEVFLLQRGWAAEKMVTRESLESIRRRLREGRQLPKEAHVLANLYGMDENPYRYRDVNWDRAVVQSLVFSPASPEEHQEGLAQANCLRGERCGRLLCFICRQSYWFYRRQTAEYLVEGCGRDDISWCTIVFGVSQLGYPLLEDAISDFRCDLRTSLERFDTVGWTGRVEIDYLDPAWGDLGKWKHWTLRKLGFENSEMAALVAHAHLIFVHPKVLRAKLDVHLRRKFPISRQVELRGLKDDLSVEQNLDNLVRYPLKGNIPKQVLPPGSSQPARPDVLRYLARMSRDLDGEDRNLEVDFQPRPKRRVRRRS